MARGMFEVYAKVSRENHKTRLVTVRLQKENLQLGRPSRDANTAHLSTPTPFRLTYTSLRLHTDGVSNAQIYTAQAEIVDNND
jgi:hypothetical protein